MESEGMGLGRKSNPPGQKNMVNILLVHNYGRGSEATILEPVAKNWCRVRAMFNLKQNIEGSFHGDLKNLAVFVYNRKGGESRCQ